MKSERAIASMIFIGYLQIVYEKERIPRRHCAEWATAGSRSGERSCAAFSSRSCRFSAKHHFHPNGWVERDGADNMLRPVYHEGGLRVAEREGFEPSRPVSQPTRLAGERLQPLGHLSTRGRYSISQEGVVAILSGRSQRQAPRLWRQTSSAETRTKRRCTMASDRENAVEHQRFKTSDASRRGT